MNCRLCGADRPLRKSHILPEFYYKPIYESSHRLKFVSSDAAKPDRHRQKGLWERLLCDSCEQKFSRWETYAKSVFDGIGIRVLPEGQLLTISNINYGKFRLFLLSLLWRMGVSKLDFFKEVNLGAKHEAALRSALIGENPLDPLQYPCALIGVLIGGTFHPDGLIPPIRVRGLDNQGYWVLMGGFLYHFIVMSHTPPAVYARICISKANEMRISIQHLRDIRPLAEIAYEFGTAIRKRDERS